MPNPSSPSGTSAKTVSTAKKVRAKPKNKFAYVLEVLKKKTPEQVKQDLIRIGIYNEAGELMPKYKPAAKKKKSQE